ncbi:MAG: hydantoinase B/oxoprolinase family protein [Rhodobacteraceae bacterium]|nr:hydantoinase B/oxoprolinase family protein [Paracoccaceae bacterium]
MSQIITAETGLSGTPDQVDPVTFEVLRSLFDYAAARMSSILQRSSFSQILADNVDFSNAIYDAELRLLAQAANCPVHLAAMHFSAKALAAKFDIERLEEGDILVVNDPYNGGTHINDLTFMMPIMHKGRRIAFAVSRGHWMDLGGGAAGGLAGSNHVAAEGLRVPPLKIFRAGKPNEDVFDILLANSRTPQFIRGDLQAHLGALRGAEREMQRAAERYGTDLLLAAMRQLIAYTERISRKGIEAIPDGVYEAEDWADTDGQTDDPVKVKVTIKVEGSDITVDFEGSDRAVVGAINSPVANTAAAVYYALQFFVGPDAPANAGMFAPIRIVLPDDCWLNAKWPMPVVNCTCITAGKVAAAVWQALAKAIPGQIIAPTFADANWFMATVTTNSGTTLFTDILSGGWGGTPFHDGMSVTMDPLGNCLNTPAESAELMHRIVYERFDLLQDSGGAGRNRGGLGSAFEVRFLGHGTLGIETSRTRSGSPGVNGGDTSPAQRMLRIGPKKSQVIGGLAADGSWKNPISGTHAFAPGEVFRFEATGGGGWGNPLERDPAAVLDDVLDEYVSREAANSQYGVVLSADGLRLDPQATAARRAELSRERRNPHA